MSLSITFDDKSRICSTWNETSTRNKHWKKFLQTIDSEDVGFFQLPNKKALINASLEVYEKFQSRTNFVQIGIGGSSLGAQMLTDAMNPSKRNFIYINNIDPDEIFSALENLDPKKSIFYFVSKSGSTAETMAALSIIRNWLSTYDINEKDYKNYFVFATDPKKSQLLELSCQWEISTLEIPSNIGGRFSVLTPVGLLPALFAGIDTNLLMEGAKQFQSSLLNTDLDENILLQVANYLMSLKDKGVDQTVIMPYSSKLRSLSDWFVQLWAESLGKVNEDGKNVGLTPIASYGATDQHSQVQLFMQGPHNKCVMLIKIENFEHDYDLKGPGECDALAKLSPFKLSELMQAELEGTMKAFSSNQRPYLLFTIEGRNANDLGQLIIFLESLTVLSGHMLGINPFDQPGVEAGKRFAFEWLQNI